MEIKVKILYRGFVEINGRYYTVSICMTENEVMDYMNQFCYQNGISGFNIQKILM